MVLYQCYNLFLIINILFIILFFKLRFTLTLQSRVSLTSQGMNVVRFGGAIARSKWLGLEKRFANNPQSKVIELNGNLQTHRKDNFSMSEYLLRAKTIYGHITPIDKIILNMELVLYILNGFGPKYLSFFHIFQYDINYIFH